MDQTNVPQFGTTKKASREEATMPWRSFTVAATIFILIFISYAGLTFGYKPFLEASITDLEKKTQELDNRAPDSEKESGFITFYSQVTNIKKLLDGHKSVAGVLDFLETRTLPNVAWESIKVSSGDRLMLLNGVAKDYEASAQQFNLFETSGLSTRLNIGNVKYTDSGIRFDAKMTLVPDIFLAAKSGFSIISEKNATEQQAPIPAANNVPATQEETQPNQPTR